MLMAINAAVSQLSFFVAFVFIRPSRRGIISASDQV
jgi:hypothetical protein